MSKILIPFGDRVLLKPIITEEKRDSGIIIPEIVAKNKTYLQGEVLRVGPGTKNYSEMKLKKGDKVAFEQSVATAVTFENQDFVVIREEAVMFLLDESDKT